MGNLSLVKLKGIVPAKSAPVESGMFYLSKYLLSAFCCRLLHLAGSAHSFNTYLNDFLVRYLEYSSEGDSPCFHRVCI